MLVWTAFWFHLKFQHLIIFHPGFIFFTSPLPLNSFLPLVVVFISSQSCTYILKSQVVLQGSFQKQSLDSIWWIPNVEDCLAFSPPPYSPNKIVILVILLFRTFIIMTVEGQVTVEPYSQRWFSFPGQFLVFPSIHNHLFSFVWLIANVNWIHNMY